MSNETSMHKAMKDAGIKTKNFKESQSKYDGIQGSKNALQNNVLGTMTKNKELVEVSGLDGKSWRGFISSYDDFSILLKEEESQNSELIFKHSITSIKTV